MDNLNNKELMAKLHIAGQVEELKKKYKLDDRQMIKVLRVQINQIIERVKKQNG